MTATKNNDTKETVTDLASGIIPGLRKHFPNGAQTLTFGGGSVTATVDQTVTNLQALIDNRTAVTTAQAAVKVAIAAENGKMPACEYRLLMACITNSVVSDPSEWSTLLIGSTPGALCGSHQGYVANPVTGAPAWPGKGGMVAAEAVPASPTPSRSAIEAVAAPSDDANANPRRNLRAFMIGDLSFFLWFAVSCWFFMSLGDPVSQISLVPGCRVQHQHPGSFESLCPSR